MATTVSQCFIETVWPLSKQLLVKQQIICNAGFLKTLIQSTLSSSCGCLIVCMYVCVCVCVCVCDQIFFFRLKLFTNVYARRCRSLDSLGNASSVCGRHSCGRLAPSELTLLAGIPGIHGFLITSCPCPTLPVKSQ